ncbi:uncharacterized protein LOC110515163 [Oncorhynchus mykiss]|uniref:uncharacterized protein LOC110515163 n=1 Tax=Oncorhynchus mykiss TaxID=8022 RepID=UPI001877936E|nr:uncharacterized protein LOC110515163 [Oncorhynchus mykiss]
MDDHLTSEAVNEMKQSSTVETTEEESLNSVKNLESFSLIINFLQNLTEEQWSRIRNGISDPLTKQQLAGLCLRIVQFLSDKLMQIIIPGLYELLGIKDAASSPLSQRSLTVPLTSLLDDKVNTKSRVRFTEAGVPKRPGSRKSYNSFRIPTPYPSSNCMDQEEEEEQESQQPKFKEMYLTKEMGSLGSGSYCPKPLPKPAMRTSLSDVQKKTTNSDSLQVLLGVSEDTLVTCVQDSLQGSLSKLACMSNSPSGSAGSPKMTPAVMAEVIKDVKSALSVVVKSASASQTSQVTPVRGDSQTKVTESMVRELAAKLEKVDQESKSLTGQVMTMISDTMVAFVDENQHNLLKDLKDKITFLASHVGFIDDLDALIRKYESSYNIGESGSSCTLTSKSIQKLSSREFQTSAIQAVSGVLAKKVSSLSFPSSVVQSELTAAVSGQTLSGIVKTEAIHPVGSAASVVVKTFVSDMKSLAESEESPQQKSAWSAAVHIYHSIQNNLKDYFGKLQRFALKSIVTSDDNITNSEFKETVPLPCLDMKYRPSKSEPQLPESTGEVTLQRGLSECSKLLWAQTESEESKLLLTTCTKEVVSELLVLYNTEVSKEDPLYTVGEKGSDFSIERQQFVEGVLAQLGDISHSRASSPIVYEFPCQIEESRSKATALTSLLDCMKKLSSEEFKRDTTQAVSGFLVKKSNSSLTSAQPAYSVASKSCSVQNQRTLSKDICADSAAFGIIDTFVEDLQSLAQPAEVEEREPDLQENAQKRKNRIWSATTSLYKNIKKTLKGFTIHRQRSDVQRRMSSRTPTEDSGHLGTKEYLGLASQNLTQASKSVPHLPSLNQEVTLHMGVSESSKLLWTETDEGLMNNSTKQVISTILTSCEDQTSNAPCFSTVGKKISDMSLEVNMLVGGVLSQLNDISLSRSRTPCEDMFERLQGSPERTSPVSLDCSTAASKGIASSHSLSTKSLQKLSSHEFQTKAEKGVSEVLSRSFNIVEEGTTDKYLQSVSTSTTSTDIIQTIVKDLQELTQTTQSSDMVSGTSLLTTGQVYEKRIWSVARNIYYSLQSKITEFLRKDLQMSDTTLGSIQIFTYQSSPASQRASLCHLEVNQSSVTPGGNNACVDIPHKLLPKTTKLSGSMLEDIDTIRCRSADSQNTRNTSSSRSSISLTPTSKSKQSEWDFTLPGTPIPTELSAQSDFPIVRNMIIQDLFHTENLLPPSFVDKVRQAAGVVVDEMVESVENTQEDGQGSSHPDNLRSARQ